MKRIIVFVMCMFSLPAFAQQFAEKFSVTLPDSIKESKVEWVDLDNDGLLDILLLVKNDGNESYFMFIKGDTIQTPVVHTKTQATIAIQSYVLGDYNRDNLTDILVSGLRSGAPVTVVYQNTEGFSFEEIDLTMPPFSKSVFADLDNDARPEWILTGGNPTKGYLLIYGESSAGTWTLKRDTIRLNATAIEVVDYNYNGIHDLFLSGTVNTDSLFTGFLLNMNDTLMAHEWKGTTATADLNADGKFDITFKGVDKSGAPVNKKFLSKAKGYDVTNEAVSLSGSETFLSDFNSDGIVDYSFFGKNAVGDTLHLIRYAVNDFDTLVTRKVSGFSFGDLEHDGDVDVAQVVMQSPMKIRVLKNTTALNATPAPVAGPVSFKVFNRVFLFWPRVTDDLTPKKSVTYDVFFRVGGNETQAANFDVLNQKRLLTANGNNGTLNFKLLKNIGVNTINYFIQGVDNSFHAGWVCEGGGPGSGSGPVPGCPGIEYEEIAICRGQDINIPAVPNTLLFSFASGFVGEGEEFTIEANAPDTVFTFTPAAETGCDLLKIYVLDVDAVSVKEPPVTKYACVFSNVTLSVEPGWTQILWTSKLRGNLGSSESIVYQVQQPDSIFVTLTNDVGCKTIRTTAIAISKPAVSVVADKYKILRGTEVHLLASGAQRYVWTPATGLNDTDIPNPVAIPSATIQYTVTGYDSLQCSAQAVVTIVVEGTGFIPTLFTPNGDGTNDELKIYGLASATDFMLSIVNREGSVVFRTRDLKEASTLGWDGTHRGTKQPSGVYFWKVKGSMVDGSKLLLNGKEDGSLVLVR